MRTLLRLRILPLLRVSNRELAELVGVAKDGHIGCVGQLWVVRGRTKILEARGDGHRVQLSIRSSGVQRQHSKTGRERHGEACFDGRRENEGRHDCRERVTAPTETASVRGGVA